MIVLQTERLKLRWVTKADVDFILTMINEPSWKENIRDTGIHDQEGCLKHIEKAYLSSYKNNGYGLYLVERKEDNTPIGIAGLVNREGLEHPDIGFALLSKFTGCGYALEANRAVMVHAREDLKIKTVIAVTSPENTRSQALLKKLGLKEDGMVDLPGDGRPALLFSPSEPTQTS